MKTTAIVLSMLVLAAIARGGVIFDQDFDAPDGTAVGGTQWAVTNNVAVRTGADSAGTRALFGILNTDVSTGYKLSFDWKSDATASTRAANNTARFSLVFDGTKRMTIWTRAGVDLYDNAYLYQSPAIESNTWYHFELTYIPDGDTNAPYATYRMVATNLTTSAKFLDIGYLASNLITPALSADLDYIEFYAKTTDQVSYDNVKLAAILPVTPFPAIPDTGFSAWSNQYALVYGPDGHDDADGLDNLYEYGVGGDPNNTLDTGYPIQFAINGTNALYVHPQRTDPDSGGIVYWVETTTNLVSNVWKTNGVEVVGDGVFSNGWKNVTNQVPTLEEDQQFIRLRIEEEYSAGMDIYLLLGQSNMDGAGELTDTSVPDPRIMNMDMDSNVWIQAHRPLHNRSNARSYGVGPGLPFALKIRENFPGKTIGLVPCALGGSWINLWQKTSQQTTELNNKTLYNYALERALLAKQSGTIRGILWLQGESDSHIETRADGYQEKLTAFITDFRTDLGMSELPFICATIGSFLKEETWPYRDQINDVLLGISNAVPNAACADTRDITGHIGDYLHFDAASQELIGERMADRYLQMVAP